MDEIEQKLSLESKINALKKEYKTLSSTVGELKKEYELVSESKERNEKIIEDQKAAMREVLTQISEAKLKWALERQELKSVMDAKILEAENVIKRKGELSTQEQKIREIEQKNTDILNETRRIELKVADERLVIESEKTRVEKKEKELKDKELAIEKERKDFKKQITKLLKEFDERNN